MKLIDTDFFQEAPLLAGPLPAKASLSFLRYIWTVRDNAIAGFHEDLLRQRIVESRLWKLHTFIVNDPEGIRHVLIDNAANYVNGNIEQRISRFGLPDFVPLFGRVWGYCKHRRRRGIFKELDDSIDHLIGRRVGEGRHSENDFLGRLIAERDPQTGCGLSAREVHSQVITILGTGHEAVASALTWIWYLLARHPLQEARLHSELDRVLVGRTPSLENLAKLPYTRMVIAEALRLYLAVHTMAWRGALEDDEICGLKIPKGSTVSIIPWVLHRHSKLWDHPERFDPESFSPDRSAGRSRFAYLPFGIGLRVCIGASFVMTEMMLIVATLAQCYRLRLVPGHKVDPQGLILLKARYGLKTILERRS